MYASVDALVTSCTALWNVEVEIFASIPATAVAIADVYADVITVDSAATLEVASALAVASAAD